jgi:hypothetical protein
MTAHTPVEERFWLYVAIPDDSEHDCWLWTGGTTDGYGEIRDRGKTIRAHRLSYEIHHGPLSPGMFALHTCDNPPCVSPHHLIEGDAKLNAQHAVERNRTNRVFDSVEAERIRGLVRSGRSQRSVARDLGCCHVTVQKVIRRVSPYDG